VNSLNQYFSDISIVVWLILFPVTYLVHITEEYFAGGGYPDYLFKNYGVDLTSTRFLVWQGVGFLAMILGLIIATGLRFPYTLLVILAAVILSNAAIHSIRSIVGRRYEPGLVSAMGLWIPLGMITLQCGWGRMTSARFSLALTIGLTISGLVELISRRGGKLVNS
jgi:Protein of unknown function with HXXEE motif